MTPYLLHKTWIDLDNVVLIKSEVECVEPHPYMISGGYAHVELIHRKYPLSIFLGEITDAQRAGLGDAAQCQMLEDFISAWRERAR